VLSILNRYLSTFVLVIGFLPAKTSNVGFRKNAWEKQEIEKKVKGINDYAFTKIWKVLGGQLIGFTLSDPFDQRTLFDYCTKSKNTTRQLAGDKGENFNALFLSILRFSNHTFLAYSLALGRKYSLKLKREFGSVKMK